MARLGSCEELRNDGVTETEQGENSAVKPPLRPQSDAMLLSRQSRKVEAHSGLHQDRSGVRGPHRQVAMPVEKEPFEGARSRFRFDRANRHLVTVPSHVTDWFEDR